MNHDIYMAKFQNGLPRAIRLPHSSIRKDERW
jgi:hypothetical protein